MTMIERNGVYLGHLAGVPIYAHWTALLMVLLTYNWYSPMGMTWFIVALIALVLGVVLHELGHGLASRALGGQGITITLWALGGVCSSNRSTDNPFRELLIIAAGPAVSLLLALIGWLGLTFYRYLGDLPPGVNDVLLPLFFCVYFINLILGLFNLLPIFPLDGGQIVYQGQRALGVPAALRNKISMTLAVLGALGYLAWVTQGGIEPNHVISVFFMAFLLWQAWLYLR